MDFSMIWLVIFLPLMGSVIQALAGKIVINAMGPKNGKRLMGLLAVAFVGGGFLLAAGITAEMMKLGPDQRITTINVFDWITLQSINIPFELRVDPLSMTMALIVTGIGGLIHVYATQYMFEDKDFTRFFTYLNLFIAFMLVLVLGNNLPLLFIGWEGVGVCSYLLIGFWYKDIKNSKAANKAFIVNRIGDFGLTLGMFWIVLLLSQHKAELGITDGRWLSYDVILPHVGDFFSRFPTETTWISILLFIGAMGKSAQFPLYVWLPDAMAGPTPVSALIHAATMVTSGVVLMNRMSPMIAQSQIAMTIIAMTGAVTAVVGASIAFGQTDIKKVLAYSTVSQLGFMFIACGVGAFWGGMFHVITHAFFKALLFLGSGSVIYAMAHNQDMRNYGMLWKKIPVTFVLMMVGFLAIAGVPFLFSGYWSKEAILGSAVNDTHVTAALPFALPGIPTWGALAGWIGFAVATMTAFYMGRMMFMTFFSNKERWMDVEPHHEDHGHDHHDDHSHGHDDHHHELEPAFFYAESEMKPEAHEHHHELDKTHRPKEVPILMNLPLVVLAVFSTGLLGWMLEKDHFLEKFLSQMPEAEGGHEEVAHAISQGTLLVISALIVTVGVVGAWMVYGKKMPEKEGWDLKKWNPLRRAALNQFYYDWLVSDGSIALGGVVGKIIRWFDENVIDKLFVDGAGWGARGIGRVLRQPQTGLVRTYAAIMEIGVAAILLYVAYLLFKVNGGQG
jgi:NADH-quinone oxidoreductase subunit L